MLVSNSSTNRSVTVTYQGVSQYDKPANELKSATTEKLMQYTTGDRLKFTGTSGIYNTIVTDMPNQSKTITFSFVACTDTDGNNYPVILIGTQTWMVENLKTTKYNDGILIPNLTDNAGWMSLTTGAYCWYDNSITNKAKYGALYNWFAVSTEKLAPIGWHVPTDAEWITLIDYLGGENVAGGKLKESGTEHWNSPNTSATNESGFTALSSGYRGILDGKFYDLGRYEHWWSSNSFDANTAWLRTLIFSGSNIYRYDLFSKSRGLSVRCVKD